MYSGSTLTNVSGNIMGAHQKVNRASRGALRHLLINDQKFPSTKLILHFEGKNGPDSAKAKLDGEHAPWHFYDPFDPDDGKLVETIEEHMSKLVEELKRGNEIRSAFESSWLAHAIVDGLTPAHHYPFEEELEKLRGEGKETRTTVLKKAVIPGMSKRDFVKKNWQMWGAKGLFTTHALFEMGAAVIMAPMSHKMAHPSKYDIKKAKEIGFSEHFRRVAREVALLDMYEQFYKRGWTPQLANVLRKELAPRMTQTVTIAWYMAADEAGIASSEV
jgi:hypothetical protein